MLHKNIPTLCLILISLLFDDSYKGNRGTCPSDLAAVLSGRHNTHPVTLSTMSVAHYLLAFFWDPFVFSFALKQLHKFNICSLMFLSFSNISRVSQWTGPHCLQINKRTHTAVPPPQEALGAYITQQYMKRTINNLLKNETIYKHFCYPWITNV